MLCHVCVHLYIMTRYSARFFYIHIPTLLRISIFCQSLCETITSIIFSIVSTSMVWVCLYEKLFVQYIYNILCLFIYHLGTIIITAKPICIVISRWWFLVYNVDVYKTQNTRSNTYIGTCRPIKSYFLKRIFTRESDVWNQILWIININNRGQPFQMY